MNIKEYCKNHGELKGFEVIENKCIYCGENTYFEY
jgi:hypothetical protein